MSVKHHNPNPICSQHFTLILDYHSVFSNLVKGCWRELFLKINPIITEDKLINGREMYEKGSINLIY
jgi:hypothetical protein